MDANDPEWSLDSGIGVRAADKLVSFGSPFSAAPQGVIGLNHIDTSNATNSRLDVQPRDVSPYSFQVVLTTWDDALVYGAEVNWLAFGE